MFNPEQVKSFSFVSRSFDPTNGLVKLTYALDQQHFTEVIQLPRATATLDTDKVNAALRVLHLVAGISYYKAAVPAEIQDQTNSIDVTTAYFLTTLYRQGLGEFAYRNQIQLSSRIKFPQTASAASPSPIKNVSTKAKECEHTKKILVPLGGGKDSLVTLDLFQAAGFEVTPIVVGRSKIFDQLEQSSNLKLIRIERQLDPLLITLNQQGAYNGHIPISAILGAIFALYAVTNNIAAIVMSQEHSASFGNLFYDGIEINHQFSKSLDYERSFSELIKNQIDSQLEYFSLLRPLSELAICKQFAKLKHYQQAFSSCNRNFTHATPTIKSNWCGHCPKCTFVFLALAPFLSKNEILDIFKSNVLEDPQNQDLFLELVGLSGHKPFECVGEAKEAIAALFLLAEHPDWKTSPVVQKLLNQLPRLDRAATITDCFKRHADNIPTPFLALLDHV